MWISLLKRANSGLFLWITRLRPVNSGLSDSEAMAERMPVINVTGIGTWVAAGKALTP